MKVFRASTYTKNESSGRDKMKETPNMYDDMSTQELIDLQIFCEQNPMEDEDLQVRT